MTDKCKPPTRSAIRRLEAVIIKLEAWENSADGGARLDHGEKYLAASAKTGLMRLLDKLEEEA
jgi:hypothetical protein